jgi:hypothetical protein
MGPSASLIRTRTRFTSEYELEVPAWPDLCVFIAFSPASVREVLDLLAASHQPMLRLFFRPDEWDSAAAAAKAARIAAIEAAKPPSEAKREDSMFFASTEAAAASGDVDVDAVLAQAASALAGVGGATAAAAAPAGAATSGGAASSASASAAGGGKMMAVTVGAQFKTQLHDLLTVVRATTPHYVRCLKPNAAQVPRQLERDSVVAQLRCGGVLEAVRVRRACHVEVPTPLPSLSPLHACACAYFLTGRPIGLPRAHAARNVRALLCLCCATGACDFGARAAEEWRRVRGVRGPRRCARRDPQARAWDCAGWVRLGPDSPPASPTSPPPLPPVLPRL